MNKLPSANEPTRTRPGACSRPIFGQQFHRECRQYHTGCEVLDQAAHLMARIPERGKNAAAKGNQRRGSP